MPDFTSTPRSLALPIDEDDVPPRRSNSSATPWRRRSLSEPQPHPQSTTQNWLRTANAARSKLQHTFLHLPLWQQTALTLAGLTSLLLLLLFTIFHDRIFAALTPLAHKWRATPFGWTILWLLTFTVSFPPLIGYSTFVTTAGFIYGMPGWFIVASATIAGSTTSFLASRTLLKNFVTRLTARNAKFQALSLVLKHDGLLLLVMIRLCPLPYSISNGAISTIPTVGWRQFTLATAAASPKLLLHVFVGRQIGLLAEEGERMSGGTRVVSYASIALGMVAGVGTGYFIYVKTRARAVELEAEEAGAGGEGEARRSYADELEEGRGGGDDVSLHTTYADEVEGEGGYRDEFTDDEDARERDVFDVGDGSVTGDEEEGEGWGKGER